MNLQSLKQNCHSCSISVMSSMVGPWKLATMQGFPRTTLPTKVVTMSMYVTPVASFWTIWVAYTVATVDPINASGCLGLAEPQCELERVNPSAGRPQPPWSLGWCNLWYRLQGLWWWCWIIFLLHGLPAFLASLVLGPPSPHTPAAASPFQLAKS